MILILNRDDLDIDEWKKQAKKYDNVFVYRVPEKHQLGKCLNVGIMRAKYDIIAKFDDDDYYAPDYLTEATDKLSGRISVTGKHTSFVYFEETGALMLYRRGGENKYRERVKGGTLVFRRSVWIDIPFDERRVHGCDVDFLRRCKRKGYRTYSVSKYNYVCVRRADISSHTQKTNTKTYMDRCKLICHTDNFIPLITVTPKSGD